MADIINFPDLPPDAPVTVTLSGEEWFTIALRLAGRTPDAGMAFRAESKMIQQLINAGRK